MLSDAERKKAADILMEAEKTRRQAVQLSTTWPAITIEDAYAISTEVAGRKIAAGAKLIGHKVGLTSKAMQRSSLLVATAHVRTSVTRTCRVSTSNAQISPSRLVDVSEAKS